MTYTWPFRLADLGLSAIGDTITLPVTLPIAAVYAVHDGIASYYFPDKSPGGGDNQSQVASTPSEMSQAEPERK